MTPGGILVGILVASLLLGFTAPMIAAAPGPNEPGASPYDDRTGSALTSWSASGSHRSPSLTTAGGPDSDLTFQESGLPADTTWEVSTSRNGSLFTTDDLTNRSGLTEVLSDGEYDFSAAANLSGYAAYGAPDSVDLSGPPVTVPLSFYRGYELTFSAFGLPYNETWNVSVTADGYSQNRTVAGDSTDFWIPMGNFSYADSAIGYAPTLGVGSGRLAGNSSISLDFAREKPLPGALKITLDVPSADVYLNGAINSGVSKGTTTFNLTPGIWSVYVHAPGYGDYFNVTTIRSNQTVTMVVNLQPNSANPGPALLSGTAQLIIVCLAAGVAVIAVLFVVAWSRLARG